jgi:predicted ATPase
MDNYSFANKHLELSPYFGFRFRAEDEKGTLLSFDQLSSGEQHVMLMNYDVLFDLEDETLVLIDEPELSFHIEWQGQFMANLKEMVASRKDLQFIICTHAPEMFGYDWNVSVDLFEQATQQQ